MHDGGGSSTSTSLQGSATWCKSFLGALAAAMVWRQDVYLVPRRHAHARRSHHGLGGVLVAANITVLRVNFAVLVEFHLWNAKHA